MDLRDDYGCFFIQIKQPREVGFVIYVKTNYLLKHHPKFKLNYFDDKTKKMATKPFSRNHFFYYGFSGKDCVGGEAIQEYTLDAFKKLFRKNVEGLYNYNEYPSSSDELYDTMKDSKPGISKDFTKKWFEEQYQFIEKEFKSFDKTRRPVATTAATTTTTAVSRRHTTTTTKHRRTIKSKSRKTRRQ